MQAESTHPSLLERIRDLDDQVAWREFDERYRDLILRYAQRRGLQPMDAEDIRQLAVMAIARSIGRFTYRPTVGRFRDYLRVIVRNLVHHHFADQGRTQERSMSDVLDQVDLNAPNPDHDEAWEEEWRLHHYRLAMSVVRQSLTEKSLSIFEALLEGQTVEEISRRFETTPDVIYKVKQRVRERLAAQVASQIRDESLPPG
ncbi:MAG: sigma-70 family RNA polymerase sigma factor [Planctomycetota bacterium]